MSHYEERLEKDYRDIKQQVVELGRLVSTALKNAVHAFLHNDQALAAETVLGDHRINRMTRSIDRKCHAFVARYLPSAGPLRFVSSVLRHCVALERIGDYAVTVSRGLPQLSAEPPGTVARDMEMMGEQVHRALRQSMNAFDEESADLARGTKGMADQISRSFDKVFVDLLREGEKGTRPIKDLFILLVSFNRLERVSDQVKNICEEVIFAQTGETKSSKTYRVLFLDQANDRASVMAEGIARKAFPESGTYSSSGWSPAASVPDDVTSFLTERGLDRVDITPRKLDASLDTLNDYHVIVGLEAEAHDQLPEVPYHTVFLDWSGDLSPGDMDQLHRALAGKIRDLMEKLRGEDAS